MAEGFVFLVFYIHISIQWEDTEVNWNPLKPDEVAFIAASIKYDNILLTLVFYQLQPPTETAYKKLLDGRPDNLF